MRYTFTAVFFLLCIFSTSILFAEKPEVSKENIKEALVLIQDANDDFDTQDYKYALEAYTSAYELFPTPVILYRIALTHDKLKNKTLAVEFYEKYIASGKSKEKLATLSRERIRDIKKSFMGKVQITSNPTGAKIYVDSIDTKPIGVTPMVLNLQPKSYTFLLKLDGYRIETLKHKIETDGEQNIEIELHHLGTTNLNAVKKVKPSSSDTGILTTLGWTSVGIGAALLIGGGTFTYLSKTESDAAANYDKRSPTASRRELENKRESSRNYSSVSQLLFIAGGTVAATGLTLILIDGKSDNGKRTAMNILPLRSGAALSFTHTY